VTLESDLKAALLLSAPRLLPDLRLFRRQVMRVLVPDTERVVAIGLKGQADLYGLWRGGRHIELELKTATGVMSRHQLTWQAFYRSWGVPHLVLRGRDGESTEETVRRWVEEISIAMVVSGSKK
jgi:hypothetical protein